jgi:hypothetical protein
MATKTLYLKDCQFSAWLNGGEDYALMNSNDRYINGQFSGAGLNLTQYKITAIGIYGDYRKNSVVSSAYPMGNTKRGAVIYDGSSLSSMGASKSSQTDSSSKMSNSYSGYTNFYTTDTAFINSILNQINTGLVVSIYLHADNCYTGGILQNKQNFQFYGKNIRLVVTYEEIPKYTITVNKGAGCQSISGAGSYYQGTTAIISAEASTGYRWKCWKEDGNTTNPRSVTVTGNVTYTAEFELIPYTVTTIVNPTGTGTITGGGTYNYGTSVTLTAVAGDIYKFMCWNDGVTDTTRTITVTGDATYTAYFKLNAIFVDTSQSLEVFVDTIEANEIYVDITKVYG